MLVFCLFFFPLQVKQDRLGPGFERSDWFGPINKQNKCSKAQCILYNQIPNCHCCWCWGFQPIQTGSCKYLKDLKLESANLMFALSLNLRLLTWHQSSHYFSLLQQLYFNILLNTGVSQWVHMHIIQFCACTGKLPHTILDCYFFNSFF